MGISKRELLEEYYWSEVLQVLDEYNILHSVEDETEEGLEAFLGGSIE